MRNIILTKSDFKLDRKYYNAIKPGKYITELVEEMASEILEHIGIKENIDVVVVYDDTDRFNSTKEKAGYYRSNTTNRDIHIVVKKKIIAVQMLRQFYATKSYICIWK